MTRNQIASFQLRCRAKRLQVSALEARADFDPEVLRAVKDATAKLELAEHLSAQRLWEAAA